MQSREWKWVDGTVRDWDSAYDPSINMWPVKAPYSRVDRPYNYFWETRPGIRYKNIDSEEGIEGWDITDIIMLEGVMYFMWINHVNDTIKIFQSTDNGCTLEKIVNEPFDAAYAGNVRSFTVIDFVRGKPRKVYKISGAEQPDIEGIVGTQINANYNGISTGFFDNDYGGGRDFNTGVWADQIKIGDFIYAHSWASNPTPSCDDTTTLDQGYCGQVRQVTCNVSGNPDRIGVDNGWSGFDGGLINGTTVIRSPQTRGENLNYYIFPEVGSTFIFPVSGWARVFHYYDAGTNTTITTAFCNFITDNTTGFTDILAYEGSFGRLNVFFDKSTNAIQYSQPNLGGAYIEDYYFVDPDINGLATFQKYIIYFWPNSIGAMYIQEKIDANNNIQGYLARGKTIRKNLGCWTNVGDTSDSFDEWNDWFYFLGSNKEIYGLSIIFNDWELTSKVESIHETWGRDIYGELQALQVGDNVYLRGSDDFFCVYINYAIGWTKILRYWRKQKKWSIDNICCATLTNFKYDVFLGDALYHLCGETDCNTNPIESKMRWYFGESWDSPSSMLMYEIWPMILQLGNTTAVQGWLTLNVYSHRNTYKPVYSVDLQDLAYTSLLHSINTWTTTTPPECPASKLWPCEGWADACLGNLPPVVQKTPCSCSTRPDDANYCECYENKAYFLSEFANILTELSLEGSLYYFELVSNGKLSFGGFTLGYYQDSNYKGWFNPGEVVRCKNCND